MELKPHRKTDTPSQELSTSTVEAMPEHRHIGIITSEIQIHKQQAALSVIEIGRLLNEAQKLLGHGGWGPWLREQVRFSERTAQMHMRLADEYSNPQLVSDLGISKAYILLKLPADQRETFVSESHEVKGKVKSVDSMNRAEFTSAVQGYKKQAEVAVDVEFKDVDSADISSNDNTVIDSSAAPDITADKDVGNEQVGEVQDDELVLNLKGHYDEVERHLDGILESLSRLHNSNEAGEFSATMRKLLEETLRQLDGLTVPNEMLDEAS